MNIPDRDPGTRSVPTEHSGTSQTKGKGAESMSKRRVITCRPEDVDLAYRVLARAGIDADVEPTLEANPGAFIANWAMTDEEVQALGVLASASDASQSRETGEG